MCRTVGFGVDAGYKSVIASNMNIMCRYLVRHITRLDGQIGAAHSWIARRRCCVRSLLKIYNYAISKTNVGIKMNKLLMIRDAVCKFHTVKYGHVGAAFGRPTWSNSLVNRTSSCLRLVFVGIDGFATSKTKTGNQMEQNLHISVYKVQISKWSCWRCISTGPLWNKSWVNRTLSCLRLVRVVVDQFAISKTNMEKQCMKLLIFMYTGCKFHKSRHDYVHRTCCLLLSVIAGNYEFATSKTNMKHQLHQCRNNSLYGVRFSNY